MGNLIDISVERLAGFGPGGGSAPAPQPHPGRIHRASESGRYKGFGETQDPPSQNEGGAPTENPREKPRGSGTRPALQRTTQERPASEGGPYKDEKALEGTFFLETFGCQMNDHDSEKVAGVLLARGYRQVESPETAA